MPRESHVGEWLIEPDLSRISKADKTAAIEPKVIEVLVCLAENSGDVLSKERIMSTVWPDTFVSDGILGYSISELRKAFGDDARNPRIIQTIARRGYRLIAPVTRVGDAPRHQPSIGAMAFWDMSLQKDQEYFCDGIADEIINNLTHVKGFRIAARTSTLAFKGKPKDVRTLYGSQRAGRAGRERTRVAVGGLGSQWIPTSRWCSTTWPASNRLPGWSITRSIPWSGLSETG